MHGGKEGAGASSSLGATAPSGEVTTLVCIASINLMAPRSLPPSPRQRALWPNSSTFRFSSPLDSDYVASIEGFIPFAIDAISAGTSRDYPGSAKRVYEK